MPRLFVALNPNSRSATDEATEALECLRDSGWSLVMQTATSRDAAIAELREHAPKVEAVLAAGGDGTANAVAQVAAGTDLLVAILPLGTANDLARSLELPDDPIAACEPLLAGNSRAIDVGEVNGLVFLNAFGCGLGSHVTRELTRELKDRAGVIGYGVAFARAWHDAEPFRARIERTDGGGGGEDAPIELEAIQITVANGPNFGGGVTLSAGATLDDGFLDLQVIQPASLLELSAHAVALRRGEGASWDRVESRVGRAFAIETSNALDVSVDGEPLTRTPIRCRVRPGALHVACPRVERPAVAR